MKNLIIAIFIFLGLSLNLFSQTMPTASSADKGNSRGLTNNIGNNNEQISDFDGNLLLNFKTKLNLPNDMGGDFTIMYNNNVEHRAFMNHDPNTAGYMINAPEWILGYKGFALQTLNFETSNFIHPPDSRGENVPLLIPGYHFSNTLVYQSYYYDHIQILKSDGSKIILKNVDPQSTTGLYCEVGNENYGFAKVEINPDAFTDGHDKHYRRIWYKPGDGLCYYFEEELTYYEGATSYTPIDPNAIYLKSITSASGDILTFQYGAYGSRGRKRFLGITSNRIKSNSSYGELALSYSDPLQSISIFNYNSGDDYFMLDIANPNIHLTDYTIRDASSSRILYLSGITDNKGRKQTFEYYPLNDAVVNRVYTSTKQVDQYVDIMFRIDYNFYLLKKIKYYNGQESVFSYYGKFFDPTAQGEMMLNTDYEYIPANVTQASRDCYTNFMLKKRESYNFYSIDSPNPILTSTESYEYSMQSPTIGRFHPVNNILTTITKTNNRQDNSMPSTLVTVRNYSRIATKPYDYRIGDGNITIKLMSQTSDNGQNEQTLNTYEYNLGEMHDDGLGYSYYTGLLDLKSTKEKTILNGTVTQEKNETYTYEYDNINFHSIVTPSYIVLTKKPLHRTLKQDPQTLIYDNFYKNFILTDIYLNSTCDYYKTGDFASEQIRSISGIKKKDKQYNYFESGELVGKLFQITDFPGSRPLTKEFAYYTLAEDPANWGLLKSTKDLPKGTINYYYYPQRNSGGTFQASVTGKKVKYDYSNYTSSFSQNSFQMNPFKTVSLYKNEYCSEVSNTVNGTNNFTVNKSNIMGNQNTNLYPIYYQNTTPPYRSPITDYANYYTYLQSPVDVVKTYAKKAYINIYVKVDTYNPDYPNIRISGLTSGSYTSVAATSVSVSMSNNSNYVNMRIDVSSIIDAVRNSNNQLYGFRFQCDVIDDEGQVGYSFSGNPVLEYTTSTNDTLQVHTAFDQRGNLKFKVDENSIYSAYYYDGIGRLVYTALPLSFYDGNNTNYSTITSYDDANNIVSETVRINNTPSALLSVEKKSSFDSFGSLRLDQAKNEAGAYETKSDKTYNYMGLVIQEKDGEGRLKKYYYDYLQRPIKIENGDNTYKTIEYFKQSNTLESGTVWARSYSEYTKAVDENRDENRAVYTYFDLAGNKVAEKIGSNKPTVFNYDDAYRLTSVISPAGKTVNYFYDDLGNLLRRESPADEGTVKTKYDRYNRLRFSTNAAASSAERGIAFTKYDSRDRILLVGTLPSNYGFDALEADKDYSVNLSVGHFEDVRIDTANFVTVNMYDVYRKEGVFKQMPDPFWWSQSDANSSRNLRGHIVGTAFRDKPGQGWNYKIYLYDQLGRVNHMYVKFGNNPWRLVFKETDNIGNKKRQGIYEIRGGSLIGEQFYWYNYDNMGRLKDARTNTTSDYNIAKVEATYTYNKADQCGTLVYNQVSTTSKTITYGYQSNRGWLNYISNGSGTFTESLGFYNNGIITTQMITNSAFGGTQWLSYGYDTMNRLTSVSGSGTSETFLYNADGNTTYRKYSYYGPSYEMFYNYAYNTSGLETNRLASIVLNSAPKSYTYDSSGNVKTDQMNGITGITYDHRNLPLSITTASSNFKYRYDDCGNRIYKDAQGKKEYYIRDDEGLELAVYDASTDRLSLVNLYGNDIIGRIDISWTSQYDPAADEYVDVRSDRKIYYIKDHLGSIRQSIDINGSFVSAFDYYAFGQLKLSSTTGSSGEKYKFTAKERDSETGLDYFGSRYYDSRIGRWMSVDPMADKYPGWSPYNYCANNPIKAVDPDGEDWYMDEAGWYHYDPFLTAENQDERLGKGCKYIGPSLIGARLKNYGLNALVNLNEDGSIYFYDEYSAYSYIYRTSKDEGVEVGGFITENGVWVLPYYLQKMENDPTTLNIDKYVKILDAKKGLVIIYQEPKSGIFMSIPIKVLALIHTHPDGGYDSYSREDRNFSSKHIYGRPIFTMTDKNHAVGVYHPDNYGRPIENFSIRAYSLKEGLKQNNYIRKD